MEPVRAGIIGIGKMGILHGGILRALDGVKVQAIADKDRLISGFIANILPDVKIYHDYRKMLEEESLDLVYITTPTFLHPIIAEECISRRLNFFVEKPLGTSSSECISLLRKSKQNSVINMVGYCKHYVDTFRKAKEILDSGILGDLIHLNSYIYVSQMFSHGRGWRYKREVSGGGVLNILATHLVDILLWFFGDVLRVSGNIKLYYSSDVEDFVHAYLIFANRLEGYLDASWSVRDYRLPEIKVEVNAKNGKLVVTDDYVKFYLDKTSRWETYYKQDLYKGVYIDVGGPEYTMEDREMIESIRRCKNPEIDVSYAFKVQRITDTIYESASKQAPVEVDYQEA